LFFVALSHRWLTEGHPGPQMPHLAIVTNIVKLYLDPLVENHQKELFTEGLRASNRWYGSSQSAVWLRSCGWTAHHMREIAVALPHFAKLQFLDLGQNDLHDEAAKILATVLKANGALTARGLELNKLGDKGAVACSDALKANGSITYLSLFQNTVGDVGAIALADALKANGALTARGLELNKLGDKGAVAFFRRAQGKCNVERNECGIQHHPN